MSLLGRRLTCLMSISGRKGTEIGKAQQHSNKYREVINSDEWKARRKRMLADIIGCERCLLITEHLELHHKHYRTLGNERDEDIEVLCNACHKQADLEREISVYDARYSAQVDGWATKIYGEDWAIWKCVDDVSDEFDEWLERKGLD